MEADVIKLATEPITSNKIAEKLGFTATVINEDEVNVYNILLNICRALPAQSFNLNIGASYYQFIYNQHKWTILYETIAEPSILAYVYHKEVIPIGNLDELEKLVESLLGRVKKENLLEILAIELKE